jgi:serine/threonine-protein kinase
MPAVDDSILARAHARVGTVLHGKYRLHRLIGIGGMAAVYVANHRNGKEFAIKVLHPELSTSKDVRSRFVREGYLANAVKHTGAVAVIDDDVAEDGAAYLVMEMLHGQNVDAMAELRPGSRLPMPMVVGIGLQLLDVLAAAHASGVVHRDIKPANLMLTRDGRVKVLDFGIARIRDITSKRDTQVGYSMGTPAYMAPEQAMAKADEIDAQSDLWAAGATLFALASGQLVHEADNAQQILIKAATMPARSLASVQPDVPHDISTIIDRALAFKKSDRWANAVAMREALREAALRLYGTVPAPEQLAEMVEDAQEGSTSISLPTGEHPAPTRPSGVGSTTVPSRSRRAPAMTTADGVETDSRQSRAINLRSPRTLAAAAIGSAIGVVAVLMLLRGHGETPTVASAAATGTSITTATATPTASPTATATAAATPPPSPTPESVPVDQLPVVRTAPPPRPRPAVTASPAPAGAPVAAAPAPAPPPPPSAKPNCTPPYDFDAKGNKRWKRECF